MLNQKTNRHNILLAATGNKNYHQVLPPFCPCSFFLFLLFCFETDLM